MTKFNDIYTKYAILRTEQSDIANIKNKLLQSNAAPLSKAQLNDINAFYTRLTGHKVPTYWHQYFTARNGNFSVNYLPTSFYHKELIYRLNNYRFRHAYVDKGIYDIYFPDVNRPMTIVKNMNGYFYDSHAAISENEALERCQNISEAIIKPTQEGMWGEGVRLITKENDIRTLFREYGSNFIIQQRVQQSPEMAQLNPTSLNTLRVLSYRHGNEIFILYAVVRIGRLGKSIDNETAGGINADIDLQSGRIIECAYGTPKEKKILTTDNGTTLRDYPIPAFDKVIAKVKELHLRLPYFNIVGWDWGVDADNEPILIEWNRCPDLSQTAHGPAFGDMTEEIIKRTLSLPDTRFL